jgi:hypothetical protein
MNLTENVAETLKQTKFKPALKRSATGGNRTSFHKRPVSKLSVNKSIDLNPVQEPDSPKPLTVVGDNDKYK